MGQDGSRHPCKFTIEPANGEISASKPFSLLFWATKVHSAMHCTGGLLFHYSQERLAKLLKIKIGYLDLDTNHQTFQGEKFSLEKEREKERTIFICFKVVTCNAMAMATMNITACLNSY